MVKDSPTNPGPIVREELQQAAIAVYSSPLHPSPPASRSWSLLISSKQLTILALPVGRPQPQSGEAFRLKASFFLLQLRFALFIHPSMGLFSSPAKVYKPVAEVDLGPGSDQHYISPNVRGQSCVLTIQFRLFRVCWDSEQ